MFFRCSVNKSTEESHTWAIIAPGGCDLPKFSHPGGANKKKGTLTVVSPPKDA